ncbi:MAG: DUF3794 domain-containing protein [Clostridia bacterium]|nr:DUF3794 domain-containing protein [Clostridia bacterium]
MEEKREILTVKQPTILQAQTGVECKLPVELPPESRILQVTARAVPLGAESLSGEAQYAGRVLFCTVYAAADGTMKKCECGVEFRGKAEDKTLSPHSDLNVTLFAENVRYRTVGETVYLSAVVSARLTALTPCEYPCYGGAEGVVCKRESLPFTAAIALVRGETELVDEWDDVAVNDVLLYTAEATVERQEVATQAVIAEGKTRLFLLLRGERIFCAEKTFPFRIETEAPSAMPNQQTRLSVCVADVRFDVVSEPDKNLSHIEVTYALHFTGELYEEKELCVVTDAFSPAAELICEQSSAPYYAFAEDQRESCRTTGRAPISEIEEGAKMLAAVPLSAWGEYTATDSGAEIEGGISAALFYAANGAIKCTPCDLPITVPLKMGMVEGKEGYSFPAELFLERLTADFEGGGVSYTTQVSACVKPRSIKQVKFLSRVKVGEEKQQTDCAVRICFVREGSDLWTLSKTLGVAPERVASANPDLTFPLPQDECVLLYNQKVKDYEG